MKARLLLGIQPVSSTSSSGGSTGGLTDGELRAAPVPVSGTVNATCSGTVAISGSVPVTGAFFPATQPVSATTLPLPSGASTEATLAALSGKVTACNTGAVTVSACALPSGASTEATLALIKAKTDNLDVALSSRAVTGLTDAQLRATALPVSGTFFQATQPVSAAALPLPSGAATEATLAAIKAKTDNLDVALSTRAVTGLTDAQLRASAVPVSGAFFQASQPVTAASLPLPSGAATEATLALIKAKTDNLDVALSSRAVTGLTDTQLRATALPVSGTVNATCSGTVAISGSVAVTGTFFQATQPVSSASLPLPSGASTEATLALIKAKTDNLDVALSTRAVTGLTDAQLRASAVAISASSLPLPTGAATSAAQTTGNASLTSLDGKAPALGQALMVASLPVAIASNQTAIPISGTVNATCSGTVAVSNFPASQAVTGSFFQATQPVSATSLPLPSGAATEATLALIKAKTDNLDVALSTRAVTGLTDTQLRASAVPISVASLPLPSTAATDRATAAAPGASRLSDGAAFYDAAKTGQLPAALVGGRVDANNGAWLGSTAPTVGQKTAVNSLPVILASDQTLPLPTGAATEATLSSLNGKVTACNTGAVVVSTCALPAGAATETTLAALNGKVTACNTGAVTVSTCALPAGAATEATLSAKLVTPTAKGTQAATATPTQDLKDSGRVRVAIIFQSTATATADTLLSLVKIKDGTAAAGATTIPVTSGKTLRLTTIAFSVKANAAAAAFGTLTLRVNPAGAAIISSPSELRIDVGNTEAVAGAARLETIAIPEGFEYSGTAQIACSLAAQATTNIVSVALLGYEY